MTSEDKNVHPVFKEWSLYEKIIHFNYMRHTEMIAAIQDAVSRFNEPLHVLDLGCGDGWMASQGLKHAKVDSYTGVDLSESALRSVKEKLASLTEDISLHEANIQEYLNTAPSAQTNLILASYSLHHFQEEDQLKIIDQCAARLQSNGCLIWIDLCKEARESRDDYLRRFWSSTLPSWNELTDSEVREVKNHMKDSDFPLSSEERSRVAEIDKFDTSDCLYRDAFYSADYLSKG